MGVTVRKKGWCYCEGEGVGVTVRGRRGGCYCEGEGVGVTV